MSEEEYVRVGCKWDSETHAWHRAGIDVMNVYYECPCGETWFRPRCQNAVRSGDQCKLLEGHRRYAHKEAE